MQQIILAVKHFCSQVNQATRQHIDSKKLEIIVLDKTAPVLGMTARHGGLPAAGPVRDFARIKRTQLPSAIGQDHIHKRWFYGFRLHALVDDAGQFCRVLLRTANEHDVVVAPRLLNGLQYKVITGDKGYLNRSLRQSVLKCGVDLVVKRRRNQIPLSNRE